VDAGALGAGLAAIRVHLAGRTGPLLMSQRGGPMPRQEIARSLARLARGAGLPPLTPHMLRHTAATLAILHGGPDGQGAPVEQVQEMLGHSVITTTMRYVHAAGRVERSAVHGLAAALRRREGSA
jgi:site-specific recombinase XerD